MTLDLSRYELIALSPGAQESAGTHSKFGSACFYSAFPSLPHPKSHVRMQSDSLHGSTCTVTVVSGYRAFMLDLISPAILCDS